MMRKKKSPYQEWKLEIWTKFMVYGIGVGLPIALLFPKVACYFAHNNTMSQYELVKNNPKFYSYDMHRDTILNSVNAMDIDYKDIDYYIKYCDSRDLLIGIPEFEGKIPLFYRQEIFILENKIINPKLAEFILFECNFYSFRHGYIMRRYLHKELPEQKFITADSLARLEITRSGTYHGRIASTRGFYCDICD